MRRTSQIRNSVTGPGRGLPDGRGADCTFYEKSLIGCRLGSVNAHRGTPRILDLWRAGRLDIAGMVTARRPLDDISPAIADPRAGTGVRTVLEMGS